MRKISNALLIVTLLSLLTVPFSGCEPSSYKLSSSASPSLGGMTNPHDGVYEKGTVVDVTATPASGYRFDHWEGSAAGTSATVSLTMDADKTLTAHFVRTYTLTAAVTPAEGGEVSPSSGIYDEGEDVTLAAMPAQDHKFDGWSGDASGASDHVTIVMNSDKNIVASFVRVFYTVQGQVDGSIGGTVGPAIAAYEPGVSATLTATPASGYRFDHWEGSAGGTSNPLQIVVDSNKVIIAYFVKTYILTTSGSPDNSCTVSPWAAYPWPKVCDAGSQVAVSSTAKFPYVFHHWAGTDDDSVNPTIVTVDTDKAVIAYYREVHPGETQSVEIFMVEHREIPIVLEADQWVQAEFVRIDGPCMFTTQILGPDFAVIGSRFPFQATHGAGTYYVRLRDWPDAPCRFTFNYTLYS